VNYSTDYKFNWIDPLVLCNYISAQMKSTVIAMIQMLFCVVEMGFIRLYVDHESLLLFYYVYCSIWCLFTKLNLVII